VRYTQDDLPPCSNDTTPVTPHAQGQLPDRRNNNYERPENIETMLVKRKEATKQVTKEVTCTEGGHKKVQANLHHTKWRCVEAIHRLFPSSKELDGCECSD